MTKFKKYVLKNLHTAKVQQRLESALQYNLDDEHPSKRGTRYARPFLSSGLTQRPQTKGSSCGYQINSRGVAVKFKNALSTHDELGNFSILDRVGTNESTCN